MRPAFLGVFQSPEISYSRSIYGRVWPNPSQHFDPKINSAERFRSSFLREILENIAAHWILIWIWVSHSIFFENRNWWVFNWKVYLYFIRQLIDLISWHESKTCSLFFRLVQFFEIKSLCIRVKKSFISF